MPLSLNCTVIELVHYHKAAPNWLGLKHLRILLPWQGYYLMEHLCGPVNSHLSYCHCSFLSLDANCVPYALGLMVRE